MDGLSLAVSKIDFSSRVLDNLCQFRERLRSKVNNKKTRCDIKSRSREVVCSISLCRGLVKDNFDSGCCDATLFNSSFFSLLRENKN